MTLVDLAVSGKNEDFDKKFFEVMDKKFPYFSKLMTISEIPYLNYDNDNCIVVCCYNKSTCVDEFNDDNAISIIIKGDEITSYEAFYGDKLTHKQVKNIIYDTNLVLPLESNIDNITDTDKENARQIIERTNFNADYDVIEESLQSLKTIDIEIICGVLMDIALELKEKYGKSRLEIFAYHVNDINYLLFDNKNKTLKEVEMRISIIADNMN